MIRNPHDVALPIPRSPTIMHVDEKSRQGRVVGPTWHPMITTTKPKPPSVPYVLCGSLLIKHKWTLILSCLDLKKVSMFIKWYVVKIQCLPMISSHRSKLRVRAHSNKLPIQAILWWNITTQIIWLYLLEEKTNIPFIFQKEGWVLSPIFKS